MAIRRRNSRPWPPTTRGGSGRCSGSSPTPRRPAARSWSFASGVLVLIVLAASVVVFGTGGGAGSGPNGGGAPTAMVAAAMGTPTPAECRVAPRDPGSIPATGASPIATGSGAELEETALPPGEPADDETIAAVEAVLREWTACGNAGDGRRWAALFSDRYLSRWAAWDISVTLDDRPPTDLAEFLARAPTPLPIAERLPTPNVRDVRTLPDGRVVATIDYRPSGSEEAFVLLFARVADRFRIDGFRPVVSAGTPTFVQAGLEATVDRSEVRLRATPSGHSPEVERLARGTTVRVTGEAVEVAVDGTVWWPVENPASGRSGYVLSTDLVPAPLPESAEVDQTETVIPIAVDAAGVERGDPAALARARTELDRALARYAGCRVAVADVVGPEEMVPVGLAGTAVADRVADALNDSFPDLFRGTTFTSLVSDDTPADRVDLRLWFDAGCGPAAGTPNPQRPAPTAPARRG